MNTFAHKQAKRIVAAILSSMMLAVAFAGCGSQAEATSPAASQAAAPSDAAAPAAEAEAEPFEITMMARMGTAEAPGDDNAVMAEIQRITGTKLNIEWVPAAAYPEKLTVVVSANDYPMLTLFEGGDKPKTIEVDAVRAGVFWKVGDYIQDYPNLTQLDSATIANATIDGELWGMFRTRPVARNGLYYRKDWADNLGLSEPKNTEELYNMLKAFVEQDPDGNGADDTNGLAQEAYLRLVFAMLQPSFGLGNSYTVTDGALTKVETTPEYLEMLKFIKRLYDDGLMNRDFPTVEETRRDEMMANNYGMAITSIDKGANSIVPLKNLYPDADFQVMVNFPDVSAPILGRSGFDSKYYISKDAVPEEADVRRIMEFFDVMHTPEINNLVYYGIEGEHYTKVNDTTISVSDEQSEKYQIEVYPIEQMAFRYMKGTYTVEDLPYYDAQVQGFFNNYDGPNAVDVTLPLNSETFNTMGTELERQIWDAGVKFVTGAIDEAGWQAEVQTWRDNGGDAMVAEYQEAYSATNP